jgi:hypothetical protein
MDNSFEINIRNEVRICFCKMFLKLIIILKKLNYMFLDDFNMLMLKIKKNLKKYYFNTFLIEKHFLKKHITPRYTNTYNKVWYINGHNNNKYQLTFYTNYKISLSHTHT